MQLSRQSLDQLQLLRSTTGTKLEEIGALRKATKSLESMNQSILCKTGSLLENGRADAAAVVCITHANIFKAVEHRILDSQVVALRREVTIQKHELEKLRLATARRRQVKVQI